MNLYVFITMKIVGIYKITSPSGKVYIGQSKDIKARWKKYQRTSSLKTQTKIRNSINKYGALNHIFEIIEECTIDKLIEREVYWKIHYDSVKNGLNCHLHDSRGREYGLQSSETKAKRSEKMKELAKVYKYKISKPILQYDPEGILIKEWQSIGDASREFNLDRATLVATLKGRQKTCGGFIWKYKKN